jgi:predicted metal-dependent HD superfamily phosphohydrolase
MDAPFPADLARPILPDFPGNLAARVSARYAEPHRRYHTWAHVLACLEARERITRAALPEVDLALLFHDAIYDPLAKDNEARSAALLVEEGRRAWIDERLLQRAHALVLATKHDDASDADSEEACIVVDADLSILGSAEATFEEYERNVRGEYVSLDEATYSAGRSAALRAFLDRPTIYATRRGQRLWEASARKNLERSLARLVAARPSVRGL